MALPAAVADQGLDGVLAQDEALVGAHFHTDVGGCQDVEPPRPWKVLRYHYALCATLIVHLRTYCTPLYRRQDWLTKAQAKQRLWSQCQMGIAATSSLTYRDLQSVRPRNSYTGRPVGN